MNITYKMLSWEDTIPFVAPVTGGQVVKVYDGDTITIASKLPYDSSPMYRFSVRLNGIDTPEIKGKNEEGKTLAKKAREELTKLIMNKEVTLENVQTEKYGRILADVHCEGIHLNNWLVEQRYAVKYDGGTKVIPLSWMDYHLGKA